MPKKPSKINFDYEDDQGLVENLIPVHRNFYLRKIRTVTGIKRFSIPTEIKKELELKVKDDIYFVEYPEGFYIIFNRIPDVSSKSYRKRKLIVAGAGDTLYTAIPPLITNYFTNPIVAVKLLQPQGVPKDTWRIQFLFTDFT